MSRQFGRRSLSKKRRFAILQRDAFTCQYCGRAAPEVVIEVDHVIPVLVGGTDEPSNLVTACRDCNGSKSDKLDAVRDRWTEAQYDEMIDALSSEMRACQRAQRELAREYGEKFGKALDFPSIPRWGTVRPTVLALSGLAAFRFSASEQGDVLRLILGTREAAEPGSPANLYRRTLSVDTSVTAYLEVVKRHLTRGEQIQLVELIVKRTRDAAETEGRSWP